MDVSLSGQVIVITGSTQGLGEAIARLAADSGAAGIVVTGRDVARGQAVAESLPCPAQFVAADLADAAGPPAIIAAALERFGRIDGLVNAAALTDRSTMLNGDVAHWNRMFSVNARAPYFMMQGAIADMLGRKAPGSIVNILSINIHCGAPDLAVYSATKGALATLTRNAANAHLRDRIRVNGIVMGWTLTPAEHQMQSVTLGRGDGWLDEVNATRPLGRLLTPEELARLTVFLLSDASGLMTGSLIEMEQRVLGA